MSDPTSQLAVIVINYNTPGLVAQLIDSIKQHTRQVDYEIVVFNNGCRPDGQFNVRGSTFVRVIESPENLGFAAGVNRAAQTCKQPFLLFVNSDCLLTDNIIPRLVKYLDANPEVAACSPRLVSADGRTHSSIRRFPTHQNLRGSRGAFIRTRNDYTIEADESRMLVEAMSATFFLIRREDFETLGGFDERFFMYVEDTDLCWRLHERGRKVAFLGDMTVIHHWGGSSRQMPLLMKWRHHQSILKYFRKHYPAARLANTWLAAQIFANFVLVATLTLVQPRAAKK